MNKVLEQPVSIPGFADVMALMRDAEQADGWLLRCHERGEYVALCKELIRAMALQLSALDLPILEVCAGDGSLSHALRGLGIPMTATDIETPRPDRVLQVDAKVAIECYRPGVVFGSFVPIDLDLYRIVDAHESVQAMLILGSPPVDRGGSVWDRDRYGWRTKRLPEVERWLVTRHDVWIDEHNPPIRHGRAWLMQR